MASCLPPLVPAIKEDAGGMIQKLMQLLLESDKYAERKGAAYGLAGLVKGLGILSLKQQEMMTTLTDAIQDKKNFRRREGKGQKLFPPKYFKFLLHLLPPWSDQMIPEPCAWFIYIYFTKVCRETNGECLS